MREIDVALFGLLDGDAELKALGATGVYRLGAVPREARRPFVAFGSYAPAPDAYTLGGWASASHQYVVKAVDEGQSAQRAQALAARVQALLTGQELAVAGYTVPVCRRQRAIEYDEVAGATVYQHAGGIYLIVVAK